MHSEKRYIESVLMSNNCVTLILKTSLTKVNSLILSISQALFLNIIAYTPDFMDKHYIPF